MEVKALWAATALRVAVAAVRLPVLAAQHQQDKMGAQVPVVVHQIVAVAVAVVLVLWVVMEIVELVLVVPVAQVLPAV